MAKETQSTPEQQPEAAVAAAPPEKKPSSTKKYLMIGVPLFLLQVVAIYLLTIKVIYPATQHGTETVVPVEEKNVTPEIEEQQIFVVKDMIVNPAGTNGTRFLLTTVGFEADTPESKLELEKKELQVRDLLNTVLTSKGLDQLINVQEKESLRREIAEKTNGMLKAGKLKNVYFSKFIIQ